MKQLAWNKIPDRKARSTFWGQVSTVPVDFAALESLFCSNTDKKTAPAAATGTASPTPVKVKLVNILDSKRSNNVAIALSQIKLSYDEIRDTIIQLKTSQLSLDSVRALLKNIPTPDEIELLKAYSGDRALLGKAEQFFITIIAVPELEIKLCCFEFVLRYPQLTSSIWAGINALSLGIEQLMTSKGFSQVLPVILSIGNFINSGSFRGAASGFHLDSLVKLADTRSSSGNTNLLRYIVYHLENMGLANFTSELSGLPEASKLELKRGVSASQEHMESPPQSELDEQFKKTLSSFVASASAELSKLEPAFDKVKSDYEHFLEHFGEDEDTPPEDMMATLSQFCTAVEDAREANKKDKEQAEVKAKRDNQIKRATAPSEIRNKAGTIRGFAAKLKKAVNEQQRPTTPEPNAAPTTETTLSTTTTTTTGTAPPTSNTNQP
ncbi:Actin-binding FH2 protein [Pelomyxa schiedti]|nr:Actin-binding FH2 protein [Pelomyxa schiedti]